MFDKLFKNKYLIVLILVFAFIIRFFRLQVHSLYGDELTMVYDSYSILKTGYDQLGNFLPVTFPMGAGRPGGYIYFSLPLVALFGPTAYGIRMLSLLSGCFTVYTVYLVGKEIFNRKVGTISAFLASISIWNISLSRTGFEANFALLLALIGTYAFLISKQKPKYRLLWGLSWGLTFHTYPTYKLLLPLILPLLIWYRGGIKEFLNNKNKLYYVLSLVVISLLIFLSLFQSLYKGSEERFNSLNVFSRQDIRRNTIETVEYNRRISPLPDVIKPIFYNKGIEYFKLLTSSYFDNFSFDYLFLYGDGNPRHNMGEMGQLYIAEFISILFGLIYLFVRHKKTLTFFIYWLLISPVASTLLLERHALRTSFMLPVMIFISAYGINVLVSKKYIFKKVINIVFFGLLFCQVVIVLNNIYFQTADKNARSWAYPAKMSVDIINQAGNDYDQIIVSTKIENAEYAYLVYNRVDPELVIMQHKNESQPRGYGNIIFTGIEVISDLDRLNLSSGRILFIGDYINDQKVFDSFDVYYLKDYSPVLISKSFEK